MKNIQFNGLSGIDLAGAGVALLLSAGFVFGILQPIREKAIQGAAVAEALSKEQQHLKSVRAIVQAVANDIDRSTALISTTSVHLLPLAELNSRLADVASLANECNVVVGDLKPGDSMSGLHCVSVPILMTGSGNFCDVTSLLRALHERLPDVGVNSFRLTGNSEVPKADCNFDLNLYWRASAETPPKVSQQSTADVR